ncbi:MAG: arsR family transcriptional regulator [Puniceicoccaceae bacterium 5H]|nr:MAG: arsR family transcriptional regulator [Puniceicoccaceae bacterium 5H]
MRALVHPPLEDVSLEGLLYALSDGTRLQIVWELSQASPRSLNCAEAVAKIADLAPSTRSHHFRILREGGVIRSERKGKECNNVLRADELEQKFPGLLSTILRQYSEKARHSDEPFPKKS